MLNLLLTLFPLIFTNNLIMSVVKWISQKQESAIWLRGALIVISLLSVIATAALTGHPIDFNQLSDLGTMLAETIGLAIASHFSYKAIKNA